MVQLRALPTFRQNEDAACRAMCAQFLCMQELGIIASKMRGYILLLVKSELILVLRLRVNKWFFGSDEFAAQPDPR